MRHNTQLFTFSFLMVLLMATGCRRYTYELPIPESPPEQSLSIGLHGQEQLRLYFRKRGYAGKDSLTLQVQNLGPTTYKELVLLIGFTDSTDVRYGSYKFRHILRLPELKSNESSELIVLSRDSAFLGATTKITAGILDFDGNTQPYSGAYRSTVVTLNQNDSVIRYLNAEGHILADGSLDFRLKTVSNPATYYKLIGQLVDTLYFNGQLKEGNYEIAAVRLDTLPGGKHYMEDEANRLLMFRLQLLPPLGADSATHLHFQLYKN